MEPAEAILKLPNPFRPGAGHSPPFLAGRSDERVEFARSLDQQPVLTNLVLTGLRGVGKTVLLETLKPIAVRQGWLWAGTDLSESASVSEESIAVRILADLAPLLSNIKAGESETTRIGFKAVARRQPVYLTYDVLKAVYESTPGLVSDKLKTTLELVWSSLKSTPCRGIVLAYDEAQNLGDQAAAQQFPLSLLLDLFQSIQKKELPFFLVLTGLPTLFPKLVEARTFAERMFHVMTLYRLTEKESRDAILKPLERHHGPVKFSERAVAELIRHSGGYPYFVQFLCREAYDSYVQQIKNGIAAPSIKVGDMVRKLDSDFFAGRWNRVTDRQRELLYAISELPHCNDEFTVQEVTSASKKALKKPFGNSQINQMLATLSEGGLVYKNRHGHYSFAVPLLGEFIRRQRADLKRPSFR